MPDNAIESLFRLDLFKDLNETQRTAITSEIRSLHLKSGECLFEQNDTAHAFYFVVEGWISVFRLQKNGARTVLHVFGSGELFAEAAAMAMKAYPASADAATEATVLRIPARAYQALIEQDADVAMQVIGRLAQRMHMLINEFERGQNASGTARLASFLLEMAKSNNVINGYYELPFSKQILAARLHMQPESLSRAFSELRKYGVETSRDGVVTIPDLNPLQQLINQ